MPVVLPVPDPQVASPITPPTKVDLPAGQINPMADTNTGLSTFLEAPKPPTDHVFLAMEPAGAALGESVCRRARDRDGLGNTT